MRQICKMLMKYECNEIPLFPLLRLLNDTFNYYTHYCTNYINNINDFDHSVMVPFRASENRVRWVRRTEAQISKFPKSCLKM